MLTFLFQKCEGLVGHFNVINQIVGNKHERNQSQKSEEEGPSNSLVVEEGRG